MKVGTRVICVDDSIRPEMVQWQRQYCSNWVKKDEKYTIREFDSNDGIVDGVLLKKPSQNPKSCITLFYKALFRSSKLKHFNGFV